MKFFHFRSLLQKKQWMTPVYVGVDDQGIIQYLSEKTPENPSAVEFVNGIALPGFQNAHSHAFQYAMAGLAEKHSPGSKDDFWSWREAMYRCALSLDPEQMQAVATMLYAEMLRKGYTHVAEFHYLHHDKDGKPYSNLAEMGGRLLQAAQDAGIKITLIPVFYQKGGFGKDPQPRQRRFISNTVEEYFHLLDDSANEVKKFKHASLGFSVHSLRAVDPKDIIETFNKGPKKIPFHLHAAEQLKEIDDCLEYMSQRPVQWLLNNLPVDDRFHLVHCTHLTDDEVVGLAQSGAHAVLCPGTEGNLGDGIFRLTDYFNADGKWSIGTDSHISLNPLEDLRWLDYAQRFTTHKRNTFDDGASVLINKTIASGRSAMGNSQSEFFEIGKPFDAVIYDGRSPLLNTGNQEHLLPSILYNSDSADVYGTIVNGMWVVKDRHHKNSNSILAEFSANIKKLAF